MEITYIGHSGFLLEWDTCYWLFDYYVGHIPPLDRNKMIFVFSSHQHEDHFNPEIVKLYDQYPLVQYILSSDIKLMKKGYSQLAIKEELLDKVLSVKPLQEYELQDSNQDTITLKTLKSTDCGVAFLLTYQGKTIYHAGDLNLWVWKEETKQYNNNMTANFQKQMTLLNNLSIDVAFAPLDPRQEEWYHLGLDALLDTANIKYVFPMHFGQHTSIIGQYKEHRVLGQPKQRNELATEKETCYEAKQTLIMDIDKEGQKWKIEL